MRGPLRVSLIIAAFVIGVPAVVLVAQTMLGQGPLQSSASVVNSGDTAVFRATAVSGGSGGSGDTTAPSAPGTPMPDSLDSTGNSSITWTWTAATDNVGVTDYQITIGTSSGGSDVAEAVSTSNSLSYTRTGLMNGQAYFAKVRARDAAGNIGSYSGNSGGVQVDTAAPTFSSVSASASGTSVTVSWTTNEAATTQVRYGITSGSYPSTSTLDSSSTTSHSVTVSNLAAGTTYYFQALGTDGVGNSGSSSEVSAATPAAAAPSSNSSSTTPATPASSNSSTPSNQPSTTPTTSAQTTTETTTSSTSSPTTTATATTTTTSSTTAPSTATATPTAEPTSAPSAAPAAPIEVAAPTIAVTAGLGRTPWQSFALAYSLIGALLAGAISVVHWLLPYLANRPAEGVSEALALRVHRIQAFTTGFGWLEYPLIAFGSVVEWTLVSAQLDGLAKHQTLLGLYAALWCLQILLWLKRPLTGRVVTPRQASVPLALVRAVPTGSNHVYATVTTNHHGWFRIPAHPGSYDLRIGKEGYSATSGTETVDRTHGARAMFSLTPGRPEPTLTKPNPAARGSFWDIGSAKTPGKLVDPKK